MKARRTSPQQTAARSRRHRRRLIVGGIGVAVIVVGAATTAVALSSSSASPSTRKTASSGPHPLTSDEANRLAVSRFLNYRGTGVHFDTQVASSQGTLALDGEVDYHQDLGYAQVVGAGSAYTLEWDATTLVAWPGDPASSAPPSPLPTATPVSRALTPSQNSIDTVLALLLGLGQDRPDNAQLVAQNGAQWLRSDTVDGTKVDVIQGPASTGATSGASVVYWLDSTGQMRRVDAHLGGSATATTIDLNPTGFKTFARAAALPA